MLDRKVSEHLQFMTDLTIEQAVNIARQAEIQAKECKAIRNDRKELSVATVNRNRPNPRKSQCKDGKPASKVWSSTSFAR